MALKPVLPSVGDTFSLFGITGKVADVEPLDDWTSRVEVEVRNNAGYVESMVLLTFCDEDED